MQIGILGLGKMGGRIAEKLLREGHEVVAWNRSKEVLDQFKVGKGDYVSRQKLDFTYNLEKLREKLFKPRIFWLMLPSGDVTESIISQIADISESGDIIIDGGNSNFKDSDRHHAQLGKKGIKFMGVGVSGGIHGLEDGFCLMAGGDQAAYEYTRPIFDSLVKPEGGHNFFGTGGAGHFVKMIHNGIEYAMMQALGEGFGVLDKSPYNLNLPDVGLVWQRGSIVRSFLLDMAVKALNEDKDFKNIDGVIAASGEGKWTVEQGLSENVPVDVIAKSLEFRERSQHDSRISDTFAAKLVAALRKQFGGHEVQVKVESTK